MTVLSMTFRKAGNASATKELPIALLTVDHPDFEDGPKRFSSDPTDRISTDPLLYGTVSRGETYNFLPFSVGLPEDSDDTPPMIQLIIANLTRELMPVLRTMTSPASVTTEIVLKSSPDVVEEIWPTFDLTSTHYESAEVTLGLTVDDLSTDSYPADQFTPAGFPALF